MERLIASGRWLAAAAAVLLMAACAPGDRALEREYAEARAKFDQKEYRAAAEAAKRAAARARTGSRWHWRFRLLEASAACSFDPHAVKQMLAVEAPAELVEIEAERKIVLARAALNADWDTAKAAALLGPAIAAAEGAGAGRLVLEGRMVEAQRLLFERKPAQADRVLLDVLARANKAGYKPLETQALVNLGMVRVKQGRYAESIPFSEEAIRLTSGQPNGDSYRARNNLGLSYARLGQFERAIGHQKEAIAGFERLKDDRGLLEALGELASTYYLSGAFDQAVEYFQKAYRMAQALDRKEDAARLATNLASHYLGRDNWSEAERYNEEAMALKRAIGDKTAAFNVLNQAEIAAGRKKGEVAGNLFEQLLGDREFPSLVWQARLGLARLAWEGGDAGAARRQYEAAIEAVESSRLELEKTDFRLSYFVRLIDFYRRYVDFLMGQNDVLGALSVVESSRAKVLAERTRRTGGASRLPAGAFQRLAAESKSVLLSYWLSPRTSYVWVITPAAVRAIPLPSSAEIGRLVEDYTAALRNGADPLAHPRESGGKLYGMLLEPVAPWIPRQARVVVVPDGALHELNFETLVHEGRYWLEDAEIAVAPSLAVMAAAQPRPSARRSLLLVGDPVASDPKFPRLAHAAREMEAVAASFPASARTVLRAANATPEGFLSAGAADSAYIHFTAHAFADHAAPLNSAVVLSPGPSGRSMLYARDLMDLERSAELVAVSACRGAGAKAYSGEGLVGFAWAFLRAGAARVVAGLWDVDDEATAALMGGLYQGIGSGAAPSAALRQAKLGLLRDRAYAKPYYWGAFQIYVAVK